MWTDGARQQYAWTRRKAGLLLTDPEWALLQPLLPQQASVGRPWKHRLRLVLDAILHLLRQAAHGARCRIGRRRAALYTTGSDA